MWPQLAVPSTGPLSAQLSTIRLRHETRQTCSTLNRAAIGATHRLRRHHINAWRLAVPSTGPLSAQLRSQNGEQNFPSILQYPQPGRYRRNKELLRLQLLQCNLQYPQPGRYRRNPRMSAMAKSRFMTFGAIQAVSCASHRGVCTSFSSYHALQEVFHRNRLFAEKWGVICEACSLKKEGNLTESCPHSRFSDALLSLT